MKTIRKQVFETNSSSEHCLAMAFKEDYEDWKNGKKAFNRKDFVSLTAACDSFNEICDCKVSYETFEQAWQKYNSTNYSNCHELDDTFVLDPESADSVCQLMGHDYDWKYNWPSFESFGGEEWVEDQLEIEKTVGDKTVVAFGYYGRPY